MRIDRRQFLRVTAVAAVTGIMNVRLLEGEAMTITPAHLPRWRGFNLLEKFTDRRNAPFVEQDFEWMASWGFDFVRLPLSYWCWSSPENWREINEDVLREIDQAVEFGRQYDIHVNINFHRAPGYCVNPPKEPMDLWSEEEALEASRYHWAYFARRYRGIPNERVSFDLLNEPGAIEEETYARVVRALVEAIREEDPDRLIIADGLRWGREPVHALTGLGIAQSTRGYDPMRLTHYKASWVHSEGWREPTWPLREGENRVWNQDRLRRERIAPWKALEAKGVGVHVGEWGAFQHTPHPVVLAWMKDNLELWREAGWGWSMWNFRGAFGILDSGRQDVAYEEYHGHQLDRKMLELVRAN